MEHGVENLLELLTLHTSNLLFSITFLIFKGILSPHNRADRDLDRDLILVHGLARLLILALLHIRDPLRPTLDHVLDL